jgi:hypothetical protein
MAMTRTSDQRNGDVSGALKQINTEIRQALAHESTSTRVQELLDRYRRTEAGLDRPEASPLVAAAVRFRDACDVSTKCAAEGRSLVNDEIAEMHEATLRLMYATNTLDLEAALDVLGDFES